MGNREQRAQERSGEASCRDGGYPQGTTGPDGHQTWSGAGNCCLQEAAGG